MQRTAPELCAVQLQGGVENEGNMRASTQLRCMRSSASLDRHLKTTMQHGLVSSLYCRIPTMNPTTPKKTGRRKYSTTIYSMNTCHSSPQDTTHPQTNIITFRVCVRRWPCTSKYVFNALPRSTFGTWYDSSLHYDVVCCREDSCM